MKIVVVGAVAGGASCAARCRRLDESAEIVVLDKGEDASFANCGMPYFIGGEITDRNSLSVQTPASLKARLELDVRLMQDATSIDPIEKRVHVRNLKDGSEYTLDYDELVLALGAKPFIPNIPGIDRKGSFQLRTLQDMDHIDTWITQQQAKSAVVCGGGFIGIEMAEQLTKRGLKVTLIEAMPQLLGPFDPEMAALVHSELEANGVTVLTGCSVSGFEAGECKASIVVAGDRRVESDLVMLGFGVRPDTTVASAAGVQVNNRGGILVDAFMRTHVDHIWAVGDDVEIDNPTVHQPWMVSLAGPANRQGRLCADNIYKAERKYKGTFGSSILRSFSLTAACTGMNELGLKQAGVHYECVHLHPMSHAGYYPGASSIALKCLFEIGGANQGRLLGAQAVGKDGVANRMNVLATALQARMTMEDLAELELCYAPPFGSAKDPVNFAGMIAMNILEGKVETIQWHELKKVAKDAFVLDVRNASEIEANGAVCDTALNIPVNDLRGRMNEVPKNKLILVSCASGQRSYYACRILIQNGYKCKNLDGASITLLGSRTKL